jgi:integrase
MDLKKQDELKEFCKQFSGVSLHGNCIRISFYYKSVRCLESLRGVKVTKANIKFTDNKRRAILHEIATNKFDYRQHFPDSKRANLFSKTVVIPKIGELLNDFLELSLAKDRFSTYRSHKYRVDNHIRPKFESYRVSDVTQSDIKKWMMMELSELANKTINEVLIPLRGCFSNAHADRLIEFNPMDHIKNLKRTKSTNADPFTQEQITKIANTDTYRNSELNAFIFACWTGVRISELLALSWSDVDFDARQVTIQRGIVSNNWAATKNDGSNRTIDLLDAAYEAILKQRDISQRLAPITINVTQADNRAIKQEELSIVFINSNNQSFWSGSESFNKGFFKTHLEKAQIRHRGANQARHTFASQLITAGINERWIAKQMGHTSIAMLEKHYGKWMSEEIPDMAQRVSKILNNGENRSSDDPNKTRV